MNTKVYAVFMSVVLVAGCSSGGSTPSIPGGSDSGGDVNGDACEQEFFKTIIGTYRGTVEYSINDQVQCIWDLSMNIRGGTLVTQCVLQAETQGTATQLFFDDEDSTFPNQCLDDMGVRKVTETISDNVLPGEEGNLDNSHFPIEIGVEVLTNEHRGPYSEDETRTADYIRLFDGQVLINNVIVDGDGTITLRGGSLTPTSGILIKEN